MLSIEEIKRCIEEFKPVEFEWSHGQLYSDLKVTMYAYPLFLQRVIEGINNGTDFGITQHWDVIEIEDDKFNSLVTIGNTCIGTIDQAKEQAIKYILGEIK